MNWRLIFILLLYLGCSHQQRIPAQFEISSHSCLDGLSVFSEYASITHKGLFETAVKIRSQSKLTDARVGHKLTVNEMEYELLSLLGTSNSSVYLARSKSGKLVSIKMDSLGAKEDLDIPDWLGRTWWYEKYKTKYYESLNLPVAHINGLDARARSPVMIKEYIFGLTYEEIKSNKGLFPPNVAYNILQRLRDAMYDFRAVEEGFIPWLKQNNFDPAKILSGAALGETQNLIERGDVREPNFIFDVVREKWVSIDP